MSQPSLLCLTQLLHRPQPVFPASSQLSHPHPHLVSCADQEHVGAPGSEIHCDGQTDPDPGFPKPEAYKIGWGGGVVFKQKKTNKQKEEIKEQVLKL